MRKSKITLVLPILREAGISMMSQAGAEHLGLGYLAAYLRDRDYDVTIQNFQLFFMINQWDKNFRNSEMDSVDEIAQQILDTNPDIVGISVTGPTMQETLDLCKKLKEKKSDVVTIVGGHQVSVLASDIIQKENDIDYIVIGDGEVTLHNLVKALDEGQDLDSIPGLCFRRNGEVIHTGFAEQINLDTLPFPARDSLQTLKGSLNITEARLSTSRGCYDACTFCVDSTLYKRNKWTARSSKLVVDEIEYLHKDFGINFFWIIDDNFLNSSNASQKRAKEIAQEIIDRNLKINYRAYFRADTFTGDNELLPLLKKSGLNIVHIGFESGCQCRLDYFHKRTKVAEYYNIVELIKKNNIGLQIGFILFDPFTNFENIRNDTKFLYDIDEMYLVFNFAQSLAVFPGTKIYEQLKQQDLISKELTYNSTFKVYEYQDQKVKHLAEAMEQAYTLDLINLDKELQRYNILLIPELIDQHANQEVLNEELNSDLQRFLEEKNKLYKAIADNNYDIFLKIIELAESKWNEQEFQTYMSLITKIMNDEKAKLELMYNEIKTKFDSIYK